MSTAASITATLILLSTTPLSHTRYAPVDVATLRVDGDWRGAPPASASHGIGASVEYGPLRAPYKGRGLSLALRTAPRHVAQLWLDSVLLARGVSGRSGPRSISCPLRQLLPPSPVCRLRDLANAQDSPGAGCV